MDLYDSIVLSRDFARVDVLDPDFGFMWLADLTNEETKKKIEERNAEVLNAELCRWESIDEMKGRQKHKMKP